MRPACMPFIECYNRELCQCHSSVLPPTTVAIDPLPNLFTGENCLAPLLKLPTHHTVRQLLAIILLNLSHSLCVSRAKEVFHIYLQ